MKTLGFLKDFLLPGWHWSTGHLSKLFRSKLSIIIFIIFFYRNEFQISHGVTIQTAKTLGDPNNSQKQDRPVTTNGKIAKQSLYFYFITLSFSKICLTSISLQLSSELQSSEGCPEAEQSTTVSGTNKIFHFFFWSSNIKFDCGISPNPYRWFLNFIAWTICQLLFKTFFDVTIH